MIASILLAAALATGDLPKITVRPKPVVPDPPPVKKAEADPFDDSAKRGGCNCAKCACGVAKAPAPAPAVVAAPAPVQMVTKQVTASRAPVGHTHTCPRCGMTWDHQANPGHNCANCGTAVYVQDRSPRMVTTVRTVTVPVTAPQQSFPAYLLPGGGGCANGSCSTIRSSR